MNFDIQRFSKDYERDNAETTFRGRRRISGNFGRVWIYNTEPDVGAADAQKGYLIFEVQSFEAKITADREDVIIGFSKDSKIVSLTGEGTLTTKKVFTRGLDNLLDSFNKGHDVRLKFIGELDDPDTVNNQEERVVIDNVWINEIDLMRFEKGTVVEQTIPFGFTPQDVKYEKAIGLPSTATVVGGASTYGVQGTTNSGGAPNVVLNNYVTTGE